MTASDKVKMAVDGEPEAETMTSSSCWERPVSWIHLCVIYGLLGFYGLWTASSYQLIRGSLLKEFEAASQRRSPAAGELQGLAGMDHNRLVDAEAARRTERSMAAAARTRRAAGDGDMTGDMKDLPTLRRTTRNARGRRIRGRGRRNRENNRRGAQSAAVTEPPRSRRRHRRK